MRSSRQNPWLAAAVLGVTLLLHLALWRLLAASVPPKAASPVPVRVSILRLPPPVVAATEPAAGAVRPPAREQPPRGTARAAAPAQPGAQLPRQEAVASTPQAADPVSAIASAPPAPPGGAPPSLLDSPATRRAIREAARERSMAELGDEPSRPDLRLGNAIADSAKGDCLKGDFVGGGMGLLSLPFWALAALREKCSK